MLTNRLFFLFSISFLGFFGLNCQGNPASSPEPILVQTFALGEPFTLPTVRLTAKVQKIGKGFYSLHWNPSDSETIWKEKPSSLRLVLPFLKSQPIPVNLSYRDSGEIIARFNFAEDWLDSGELATEFRLSNANGWEVPIESIYSPFGKSSFVWQIENGKTYKRTVSILQFRDQFVLVTGDLDPSQKIVISRINDMYPESMVRF